MNGMKISKQVSSMSGDNNEMRYQKALKQITKLIGVNNDLKEQAAHAQQLIGEYEEVVKEKNAHFEELYAQNEELNRELQKLREKCKNLQDSNANLAQETNTLRKKNTSIEEDLAEVIPPLRGNLWDGQNQNRRLVNELQLKNQRKDQIISELSLKLQEKNKQNSAFALFNGKHGFEIDNESCHKKLKSYEKYVEDLSNECADLKSKLMKSESLNYLLRARSERQFIIQHSPRNGDRKHSHPHHAGGKNAKKDDEKLLKKYENVVKQLEKTKISEKNAQHELKTLQQYKEKSQKLIERLHKQIEESYLTQNQTIASMTKEFKEKLILQRQSFNPVKNAEYIKKIEVLQNQNRATKKKFNICSTQLNKCFRVLETYRTRLAECQKQYNSLLLQKQELMEKLSKHQQGLSKQKSIYSKGSNSKQEN